MPPAWRASSTACTSPAAAIRAWRTFPPLSDSAAPIVQSVVSPAIRPLSLRADATYTARVLDEPVRGGFPDPPFFSLSGLDQMRAFQRGLVLPSPVSHLMGFRLTQVGSGTAVASLPISPWLQLGDGTVDIKIPIEVAARVAAMTTVPGGYEANTATMAVHHLRPCTMRSESIIARARVLNTARTFTVTEVLVEDALGRALAHASGSAVVRA